MRDVSPSKRRNGWSRDGHEETTLALQKGLVVRLIVDALVEDNVPGIPAYEEGLDVLFLLLYRLVSLFCDKERALLFFAGFPCPS